jgi:thiamine-phosphate pyrophosphorylase
MTIDYRLYLVTDETLPQDELLKKVELAIQGGVTIVQLREKSGNGKVFYEKAVKLRELTEKYQIPLIINDRVDIALAVGADGVHVGQSDLPAPAIRKIIPLSMIVGVSVGNPEEAREAELNGANYVGVGAVFPTTSKADAKVLPPGMLDKILETIQIPAVAIGGINLENISMLGGKNIAGIAVVSGIMKANDPFEVAKAYRKLLK